MSERWHEGRPSVCSRHQEPGAGEDYADATFHVLMDVNRHDPDQGRAWITVTAANGLAAMDQVRSMYPKAAVLRAERQDGSVAA